MRGLSEPPPPRYSVVERGRRLEVIDNWQGTGSVRPVSAPPPAPPSGETSPRPPGRMSSAWPTAIVAWLVMAFIFWPLFFAPLALLDPRIRRNFRNLMRRIDDAVDTGERR